MHDNEAYIESVLAQSAHVLRRVVLIRDYGFTFDSETSTLLDQTLELINEISENEISENESKKWEPPPGPSCSGYPGRR